MHTSELQINQFRLGDWLVRPQEKRLERAGSSVQTEPRAMEVLLALVRNAGQVVSAEDLLNACWRGTFYGDNPVHKTISQLRKVLGDSARKSRYIATIRKRGYQLVAPVSYPNQLARSNQSWTTGSPFRGLQPFDDQHAEVFFGRRVAIRQVLQRVATQLQREHPFVLVMGPSGCGKTSLLQAGVIPALQQEHDYACLAVTLVKPAQVFGAAGCSAQLAEQLVTDWYPEQTERAKTALTAQLEQCFLRGDQSGLQSMTDALTATWEYQHPEQSGRPLLWLFIDQLEQVCTDPDVPVEVQAELIQNLSLLLASGAVAVVAACRNDFYHRLVEVPGFIKLRGTSGQYDLLPPTRGELSEIIRRPALAAGLAFETDQHTQSRLDDILRDAVSHHPEALPLLQHTLDELYQQREQAGRLTFAAYERIGGIEGSISRRAESVFSSLPATVQKTLRQVLALVVHIRSEDDAITAGVASWSALPDPAAQELVSAFVNARLFVSEMCGAQRRFTVAHEAVLRQWPRAKRWIEKNRAAIRAHERISLAAERWQEHGYSKDLLLSAGRPLDEAGALLHDNTRQLEAGIKHYIHASRHRVTRFRLLKSATVMVVFMLAIVAGISAFYAQNAKALAETRQVRAEQLVSFMLGDLTDRLRSVGRLDLLDQVGLEIMGYLDEMPASERNREFVLQRAGALIQTGEVDFNRSESDKAYEAFSNAAKLVDGMLEVDLTQPELLFTSGQAHFWLGYSYYSRNELTRAEKHWQLYYQRSALLVEQNPKNQQWQMELSYALNNLGTLAKAKSDQPAARQYFEQSVAIKRQLHALAPSDENVLAELADSISWLAGIEEQQGALMRAASLYAEQKKLLAELSRRAPTNTQWQHRLSMTLVHSGLSAMAIADSESARRDFLHARRLLYDLVETDQANFSWAGDLAQVNLRLGWLEHLLNNQYSARSYLRSGLTSLQELRNRGQAAHDWQRLQLIGRKRLLEVEMALQPERDMTQQQNQLIDDFRALVEAKQTVDLSTRIELADSLIVAGQAQCRAGKPDLATAYWTSARQTLAAMVPNSADKRVLDPWLRVTTHLGDAVAARRVALQLQAMQYRALTVLPYYKQLDVGDDNESRRQQVMC